MVVLQQYCPAAIRPKYSGKLRLTARSITATGAQRYPNRSVKKMLHAASIQLARVAHQLQRPVRTLGGGGGWHIRAGFSHSSVQAFMHYYKTKMTMPGAAQFGTFVYAQPPVYRYGSRGTLLATGTTPMPPTAKRPTRLHLLGLVREPAGVAISNWAESRCNVKGLISHGNFQDNATHGGDGGDVDSDDGCAFDLPAVGRARVKELILAGRCRTHLSCNLWGTDISLCGYPKKFIENAGTASSFEREHLPNNVCKSIGGSDKKAVYRECFATASKQFKEEYLLVGLTSKMKETECLLFYYTGEPWIPFPHTRDSSKVKLARQQKGPLQRGNAQKTLAECGGLGSLWPEDAHAAAVENMPRVAAIHDAASALLDERTAMARAEILARGQGVGAGHDLSLGAGCFGFSFAHPNENVTVT